MRIAVFIKSTTLHAGFGGLETQNRVLCEGLANRGHEVCVFTLKKEIAFDEKIVNNVKYVFIDATYRYLFASIIKSSWYNASYRVFEKEHKKRNFDVVLSQSSAGYGIINRKEALNVKVVSIAHGSVVGEFKTLLGTLSLVSIKDIYKFLRNLQYVMRQFFGRQREFINKSNRVIAVSTAVREQLINETFVDPEKICVIYNGINEKAFLKDKTSVESQIDSDFRLLYVGQVTKDKGADSLLDFISDDRLGMVTIEIVGDGAFMPELRESLLKNPDVATRVVLHGKLSYDDVSRLYFTNVPTIFVFPTKRVEGLPMVLVEALFAGLPIVAFNLGGVPDIVKHGYTGCLVEPGNKDAFIKALITLKNDPVLFKKIKNNSREYALKSFTLDGMLNEYEKVITEVLV